MLAWYVNECETIDPLLEKYPPLSLLAAAIPTILSSDGIWVCERVQISKQLEPFAFLFCWSFPQLLDPTCSSSSSSLCLHLTKVAKLSKCKEVAWKEALVGQRASPTLLLFAQLKKGKYGKNSIFEHKTFQFRFSYLAHQGLFLFKGSLPFCSEASRWLGMM